MSYCSQTQCGEQYTNAAQPNIYVCASESYTLRYPSLRTQSRDCPKYVVLLHPVEFLGNVHYTCGVGCANVKVL